MNDIIIEKSRPTGLGMNWTQFGQLVWFKMRCQLKSEASRHYLSYAWWLLEPILFMLAFYLVFGLLLTRGTDQFIAFLLCGLVPWLWFNKSVMHAADSILKERNLILQTRVPILLFPVESLAENALKQSVVFSLLLLFLWLYGIEPSRHWFAVLILIGIQLSLIVAASLLVAALVPFIPDLKYVISTGLTLMMFGSGIFYSLDQIDPALRPYYFINPMANLNFNYRQILIYHHWPNWSDLIWIGTLSTLLSILLIHHLIRRSDAYRRLALLN